MQLIAKRVISRLLQVQLYRTHRWARQLSSVHDAPPPVLDSRAGFTDYERERREFHIDVPEYFNFANVLDEWARKEKVRSCEMCNTNNSVPPCLQCKCKLYYAVHLQTIISNLEKKYF